jgi:hypothetical protein
MSRIGLIFFFPGSRGKEHKHIPACSSKLREKKKKHNAFREVNSDWLKLEM